MRTPVLTKSYLASAAVAAFRVMKASGDKTVAVASAATDLLVGSSGSLGVDSGGMADVVEVGIDEVRLGGNVSFGDPLTADANGKAIKAVPVDATTVRVFGFARANGVADDIIPYLAAPGMLSKPAA